MKLFKNLTLFIALILQGGTFYSCSDDDTGSIRLDDGATTIKLIYPSIEEGSSFPIIGGDGNYSAKSNNEEIVTAEMIWNTNLRIKIIGLGKTTIVITDKSQNTLTLDVIVDYYTQEFIVKQLDITIVGEDLTENDKKAISEKYLSQVPVNVNGGYKFVHSAASSSERGIATIYSDVYGDKGVETTFIKKKIEIENLAEVSQWAYEIVIDGKTRTFIMGIYKPSTRMTEVRPIALMEDITTKVQVDYPNVKSVYTSQVVEYKFD